jgi:hypothetical protein
MATKTAMQKVTELQEEVGALSTELMHVRESYMDAARSLIFQDEIGWTNLVGGVDVTERFDITTLKQITDKLREWADTNPLLSRGNEIRCSYLYGRPYEIGTEGAESTISVRARSEFDDPINQAAVFSLEALQRNEKARYTDGNVFAMFNKATRRFAMIPLSRIEDAYYNPDDPGEVWFYLIGFEQRYYNEKAGSFDTKRIAYWVPVDTFKPPTAVRKQRELAKNPIDWNKVMVDDRVNRTIGQTWGLPDSFTASPWALAYSRYMKDGIKIQQGLAEWIWAVKPKSRAAGTNTAATIRATGGGPAKTIVSDSEIVPLP